MFFCKKKKGGGAVFFPRSLVDCSNGICIILGAIGMKAVF